MLYSLGLQVPEDMQGKVPREIFQPEAIAARPIMKTAVAAAPGSTETATAVLSSEDEEVILESLRDLGYIE